MADNKKSRPGQGNGKAKGQDKGKQLPVKFKCAAGYLLGKPFAFIEVNGMGFLCKLPDAEAINDKQYIENIVYEIWQKHSRPVNINPTKPGSYERR